MFGVWDLTLCGTQAFSQHFLIEKWHQTEHKALRALTRGLKACFLRYISTVNHHLLKVFMKNLLWSQCKVFPLRSVASGLGLCFVSLSFEAPSLNCPCRGDEHPHLPATYYCKGSGIAYCLEHQTWTWSGREWLDSSPGSATGLLDDLGWVTSMCYASVFSSLKWDKDNELLYKESCDLLMKSAT